MQKSFTDYLRTECRCSPDARYLLAVSGGVDSVVMAWLFRNSGFRFSIAHCNFQLRGDESDCDQAFVEDLAGFLGVPCYVKKFETEDYALREGLSIQVAARDLRYEWFFEVAETGKMNHVAIGHNSDDVAETFFINLSRGTGIHGLTGIKPSNGIFIRPLLFASRADIIEFAKVNNIKWREDSSNDTNKYQRNAIRHIVIPEIEKLYPAFRSSMKTTINNLKQAEVIYNEAVESYIEGIAERADGRLYIDIAMLLKSPAPETILFEILKEYGCNQQMVASIIDTLRNIPGRRVITKTHTITRDRKCLIVTANSDPGKEEAVIDETVERINFPIEMSFTTINNSNVYSTDSSTASIDFEKISFPITIRRWKDGDRFHPLGMNGSKKLSDFLIDSKIPLPDKENIWVLESAGEIAWVVGHRLDDRFRVTQDTKKIYQVSLF